MPRVYNKNIQLTGQEKGYSIKESLEWVTKKLGPRSRDWLYKQIKLHGIEPKKNGKFTYLYEADLNEISKISSLSEIVAGINRNCN